MRRSCPEPYNQQAQSSYSLAQELLQSIRHAVSDLREDHTVDLAAALATLVEGIPDIAVSLDWPKSLQIDSVQHAEALFYCVQEAATNTLKHAQASRLTIKARTQENQLTVWIEDDGHSSGSFEPGNGIKGMQERIAAIEGKLHWQTGEAGTLIQMNIPLGAA